MLPSADAHSQFAVLSVNNLYQSCPDATLVSIFCLSKANVASAYILSTPPNAHAAIEHLKVSPTRFSMRLIDQLLTMLLLINSKRKTCHRAMAKSTSTWESSSKPVSEAVSVSQVTQR